MTTKFMRTLRFEFSACAIALLLAVSGADAATLDVVGGQLLGASNVDVGGNLYDVQFLDGRCSLLFDGCDAPADFVFSDATAATVASQALLDQVFVDGGSGLFDSTPSLTNGCTSANVCNAFTPFASDGFTVFLGSARNLSGAGGKTTSFNSLARTGNTSAVASQVYAVWTPVPEPGTALLMGLGLAVMGVRTRR